MRPIANTGDYPFGECGYVVDGAYLRNGTKIQNLRIYKQRSDQMYDLLDPRTNTIYQKVLITGYNSTGEVLDYSKTNADLIETIPKNTFFIRAYNEPKTKKGFVFKFLYNKIILSTGRPLYDMYTPECEIPLPDLSGIIINPIHLSDTSITGSMSTASGTLNVDGMLVTLVLPDGTQYQTTVNQDGTFEFSPVQITEIGTAIVTITSSYYSTVVINVQVIADDEDSDYVTTISLLSSDFTLVGGVYRAEVARNVHQRGTELIIQLQSTAGAVSDFSTVQVDTDGNITIEQTVSSDVDVLIIGQTIQITPYSKVLDWNLSNNVYTMTILGTEHLMTNISFTVYELKDGVYNIVTTQSEVDSDWNLTLTSLTSFVGKVVIEGKE